MTLVLWLLLLLPLAASLGAQKLVRSTYRRYSAVPNHVGLAGAEIARALLDAHGLQRVRIRPAPGSLSDNYDGDRKRLALSRAVATQRTVSAMGIAAHEVAHAYHDAEGDRAYRARRTLAGPLTGLAPWSGIALIGGYWFGIEELVVPALAYAAGLVLFALATLPVEFGASRRAEEVLRQTGLADASEQRGVRRVLTAAGATYVVGLFDRLATFLVLLFVAAAMRRYALDNEAVVLVPF